MPDTVNLDVWFYNGGPRGKVTPRRTAADIRAILETGADILGLCEMVGDGALPRVKGFNKYRDRSTESRANIATYLKRELAIPDKGDSWADMKQTWRRPLAPSKFHDPRSWQQLPTRLQLTVGHQPQILPPRCGGIEKTNEVQKEGLDYLERRMDPRQRPSWPRLGDDAKALALARPRIALADWNRSVRATPSHGTLAKAIAGRVVGTKIDAAVLRGDIKLIGRPTYIKNIDGHILGTDHPHGALHFTILIDKRWAYGV